MDHGVGPLDQLPVFLRVGLGDEVPEVRLVPDLPEPDRPRRHVRVRGPEFAAPAVAFDRRPQQLLPTREAGAADRQVSGRLGAMAMGHVRGRHGPARRAADGGQHLDAGSSRAFDRRVGSGPVERAALLRLQRAPFEPDADAFDTAAIDALELFGAEARLRHGPPELGRERLRGRRERGRRQHRQSHALPRTHAPCPCCESSLSSSAQLAFGEISPPPEPSRCRRCRMTTTAIEMAARTTIAIRIGTSGEEELLLVVLEAGEPGEAVASCWPPLPVPEEFWSP